jgi:hypothetical protein
MLRDDGDARHGRVESPCPTPSTPRPPPSARGQFAALDNPDYRRYYLGQGISLVGTWLQVAAVKWIVFDKTQSEFMLGAVEAAGLMPGLLVGLLAGVLADRVVPRRMILGDAARPDGPGLRARLSWSGSGSSGSGRWR